MNTKRSYGISSLETTPLKVRGDRRTTPPNELRRRNPNSQRLRSYHDREMYKESSKYPAIRMDNTGQKKGRLNNISLMMKGRQRTAAKRACID